MEIDDLKQDLSLEIYGETYQRLKLIQREIIDQIYVRRITEHDTR